MESILANGWSHRLYFYCYCLFSSKGLVFLIFSFFFFFVAVHHAGSSFNYSLCLFNEACRLDLRYLH